MDRGKPGSRWHVLSDANGLPLRVGLSAANTHDSQALKPMLSHFHNIISWNEMEYGGHYAGWEKPGLLVSELRNAFRQARNRQGPTDRAMASSP